MSRRRTIDILALYFFFFLVFFFKFGSYESIFPIFQSHWKHTTTQQNFITSKLLNSSENECLNVYPCPDIGPNLLQMFEESSEPLGQRFNAHVHCVFWNLAMHHVCVGYSNVTLPCLFVWQTEREEKTRWMEEGKQLFEVKEQTAELADQGKTCFHWSEPIHDQ